MPITPFHFGPGFLIKSVFAKYFSFRIFVLANIIIDLESGYFILTNQYPLHRLFHTYLGTTVVAVACIAIGRGLCYWLTGMWNIGFKINKVLNRKIPMTALIIASFIGTYSHIMFDSILYEDLHPFYPWSLSNRLLNTFNYAQLHLFCILTGLIGTVIYWTNRVRENHSRSFS